MDWKNYSWWEPIRSDASSAVAQLEAMGFAPVWRLESPLGGVIASRFHDHDEDAGVYALVYTGGELLYVGETGRLPGRMDDYQYARPGGRRVHEKICEKLGFLPPEVKARIIWVMFLGESRFALAQAALRLGDFGRQGMAPSRKLVERFLIDALAPKWNDGD